MQDSARLFICGRCRLQVWICRYCDRGNVYCGLRCSGPARRASLRAAGRRYQSSRLGRFRHAERQSRYRAKRQKVTHHGSADGRSDDVLAAESKTAPVQRFATATGAQQQHCYFCKRACSPLVRLDFLHRTRPGLRSSPWIRPPPDG